LPDITALTLTGTLDLNGFSETIGSLAGAGTMTSTVAGAILLTTGGNNAATTTFSGLIQDGAGTLSLTKAGTGIMILSGLNSYTGATIVSAGTLTLGSAGNGTNSPLGTIASGTTVNNGAALNLAGFSLSTLEALTLNGTGIASAGALNNTSTTLNSSYTGTITLASASSIVTAAGGMVINTGTITGASFGLTLGGTGNGNMQSLINTGTGTLTKIGTGIWTLSADNEFTGLTSISAGTLRLGITGNATNGPLGTVDNGVNITAGALDLNGFTLATAEAITIRGTGISAGGAITNSSATAADYSGLVTIGATSTIATNAGDLNLTNTGTITGAFALTLSGSGNGSISSIIGTGAGSIVKTGAGTWTLSGASTYTGVTTISVGTLKIGASNVGVSGNSSVTVTSTLDLNGFNATIGSLAGAGTVTSSQAGSVTLTTGGKNVSTTFSGVIENGSGTLNLVKAGTLIFTLSGLSTYTGLTTINTGTIALGAAGDGTNSPLGTIAGGTTVNTGAVLNVNGITLSTSEPLALNGTGIAAAGALINGSATLSADYSGLITLESASSIVATTAARELNITNPGTIVGAGFGLTLGGAGIGTISSIIGTGTGTLTKIGTGIWTLSGNNEFTGLTSISAGTLRLGSTGNATNGPLGTVDNGVNITAGALDLNGFTLATAEAITIRGTGISAGGAITNSSATAADYSGLVTIGATSTIATNAGDLNLTNTGTITGAFALTLSGSGNGSISSIIGTGAGSIVKTGAGTWTLSGASTYTGVTTISVGTLKIGASNVGVSGNSSVTVTSTLDLNGFNATIGSLAGAGTVTSSQAGSVTLTTGGKNVSTTFSGVIENGSGTLNLVKAGTLIFTLSGLSTYTGLTTINTGTIALGAAGDGTNSPLGTIAGGTTVNTGAVLNVNGITLSTSEPLALNGTGIAAAGALINGSATLSADYSGLITLESASSIVATTAARELNITNPGTIVGAGFGLTLGGAGIGTISSIIGTGTGTLTKIGTGIWTLSGNNEFTGLTSISAGTLRLGSTGNATNGPLGTVDNGVNITAGALDLNGFTLATAEAITIRGTGISAGGAITNSSATAADYSGLVTIGATSTIATNAGDLNLTNTGTITGAFALTLSGSGIGSISSIIGTGAGTIVKSGTGSWTLSGASTYTGVTTISVGTLKVGANNAGISNSSAVTVTSTLDLNGFNATIGSLAGAGTVTSSQAGSVSLTTGGNNTSTTFSGVIENGSGTLNLIKAGTLIFTLSGLSTYTGLTTINTGTIALGAAGDGTNSPLGTIAGGTTVNTGAVLNVNGITLSTSEPLALNGTGIAAAGALINGSATLSADYSGLITLESASSIVATTAARELNITNPGTIVGAGFGLTLGGAGIGTISSIIGIGTGTLTKIGTGTWTLSSANTFSGGTTLSAGVLNINHTQALGAVDGTFTITAGTINNTSGASITTLNYPMAWNGSFTFTGTDDLNLGTGSVNMNASIIATISANTLSVGGIITGGAFNFTKAGAGTLAFGNNDVSVTDLSITAGTLVSTSGTLSLTDDYVNNGVFTPNNGTIAFTGNTAQTIGGTVLNHVFHNFLVNKPLALTMTGGATSLTVNDYTNTLGSFTPPATFNINGNTLLTAGVFTAGTTINAAGNWTNNGGTFTAGAGTVNFNGIAQAIGGSSNHTFNHFTINPTSTLTASSGIISIAGNWVNDGAFVHNSGTVTFTRTTPQTLGGANSTTFYNLIENGLAGKTTLLINTSIANNLTITAGTLDIGLFTSNGNGGTFSVANSATAIFILQGAFPTGFATVTLGAASVITYSGAMAQVIYPVAAPGYGYLNITNTIGATAGGNLIVQNTLTISSGAILDASNSGNYDISLGLNWTNNGGTFLQRAGTVTFTGTVAQAINGTEVNQTFHHLHVNKTLALTVPATLNITGNLTLSSGTLTAGASTFIGGNMTNNGGVFTAGVGTVTFNGTTQAIAGAVPITFRNLTINSGSTLTGPATMTISGEYNNSGSYLHNNGQVTFTGTTSAITSTNTTESFYNLVLNKTAANLLSTAGSITTLNVNDFTQTLGNFTPPANFTIGGNAVFTAGTFTAGTTTNVAGNWTKATAAIFTPGTNTVYFNGSGAQSINGTSTTQTFYNLIVNKGGSSLLNTGGSTTALIVNDLTMTLGDFTAPAAFTINGNALLSSGNLTAGTNLTARGDWTNNGGSFTPGTNTLKLYRNRCSID
jgi:fibronectin-binding autotransporter adhesin